MVPRWKERDSVYKHNVKVVVVIVIAAFFVIFGSLLFKGAIWISQQFDKKTGYYYVLPDEKAIDRAN
jgi:uncharacterized membrane protein